MNLVIRYNGSVSNTRLEGGSEWVIGRSESLGTIVIQSQRGEVQIAFPEKIAKVSRNHLRLVQKDGRYFVSDMGSSNGTFIYGARLAKDEFAELIPETGRVGLCGSDEVVVSLTESAEESPVKKSDGHSLRQYFKDADEITIGRAATCTIRLSELTVSRTHARVFRKGDRFFVEDASSVNGTFINGERIQGKVELRPEDTLFIGIHGFTLDGTIESEEVDTAILASRISKVFTNGVTGLHPVNLAISSCEMVALMGPSGCGKSTLLKALNGDSPATQGSVKILGLDLARHFERLKQFIGYVPQENIVHEDLTVEQCLYYSAKLRLSRDLSDQEIETRVTEVLDALNINSKEIRANRIARLSGGQKKRVCIAVELLTSPRILFLDEPTSPLDPETIEDFLKCLRKLCANGTTVVMVTHKPDDLAFVDRVIFMGIKGHLTFDGKKEDLLMHFKCDRLIDVYALLSDVDRTIGYYKKWYTTQSVSAPSNAVQEMKHRQDGLLSQMYWLSVRYVSVKAGNRGNLAILILQPVLIGLLLMLTFDALISTVAIPTSNGNGSAEVGSNAMLFLLAISAIWFGVSNSAKEIVGEKDILKREFMFNLRLPAYFASKLSVLFVFSALQVLVLLLMVNVRFEGFQSLGLTWSYLLLVSLGAITFGLLLSVMAETTEQVMSVLPIALMPQIILAGIIQKINNGLTLVMSYFTIGRWGTEGLSRIQDRERETSIFMDGPQGLSNNLYNPDLNAPDWTDSLVANISLLAVMFLLMLVAIFIALGRKLQRR